MRVKDADRDLTDGADKSLVKLEATSGDSVTVELQETAPSSGIFLGRAKTGELPAGALASDVSIESNPLMSIDKDTASAWISEPDGAAPKWLTVDLKDVYDVTDVTIRSPKQPVPTSTWTYRDAKGQDHALSLDDDGSYEAKLGDEVKKGKWSYEGSPRIALPLRHLKVMPPLRCSIRTMVVLKWSRTVIPTFATGVSNEETRLLSGCASVVVTMVGSGTN